VTLTFGSLFTGVGGFDLGLERAGLRCLWQVEVDRPARSVLARHWPGVPRHEDVRAVGRHNLAPADVVCGGFPCQDLSTAGRRGGLKGERSGLFWEMVRVTDELRPRFLVWENVPGLLSSDSGRDFARVLRGLADIGYFGAWRVLDARHFGVPQRRRRVFGVFAPGRAGALCGAEILALAEGVRRHPPAGGKAGADLAGCLGGGTAGRGWSDDLDRAGAFVAFQANGAGSFRPGAPSLSAGDDNGSNQVIFQCHGSNVGPMGTLRQGNGNAGGGVPFIVNAAESCATGRHAREADTARCLDSTGSFANAQGGTVVMAFSAKDSGQDAGEVAPTLRAMPHDASHANGGGQVAVIIPIDMRQSSRGETMTNNRMEGSSGGPPGTGIGNEGDPSPTIADSHTPSVVGLQMNFIRETRVRDHAGTLSSQPGNAQFNGLWDQGAGFVRRLTPVECERLQGFPDGFTEPLADGPRYRCLGNAVCVPVAEWIGRRLMRAI
jgi:DNA (cytosine-5)-methyltransferase 1